jgi:predicted PP-loop superfamily ATPase
MAPVTLDTLEKDVLLEIFDWISVLTKNNKDAKVCPILLNLSSTNKHLRLLAAPKLLRELRYGTGRYYSRADMIQLVDTVEASPMLQAYAR